MARKLGQATDKKVTEKQLYEFMELSQPTISKWKKEAPNLLISIKKYCDVTGESFESLFEKV
jgi:hypothetical protein